MYKSSEKVLRRVLLVSVLFVLSYVCYTRFATTHLVSPASLSQRRIGLGNLLSSDFDKVISIDNSDHSQLVSKKSTGHAEATVRSSNQKSHEGHIFVYSSYEEQTNGARNLWQLQMWAETLKMRVVEPFAVESMFGVIGALPNFTHSLRFSDYYDIDKWNKMAHDHGGSSLVQWEGFLSNAPRKVIVLYTLLRRVKEPIVVKYGEDSVKTYNPGKFECIPPEDMMWLKCNFNITREVTLVRNARIPHPMSLKELKSYVFGNLNTTEVTLVIVNWIGMDTRRLRIQLNATELSHSFLDSIHVEFHNPQSSPNISPSWRVLMAYKNYVSQYIGDRKYVGIVFRTHCVLRYGVKGDFETKSQHLLSCSKQLKHTLDKVRNKWGIFMAYDLGTYGSDGYFAYGDQRLFPLRDQIFSDVFNNSIGMKQRDEMLMNASGGISDRGFIAILEKTIATHADCIIVLGKFSSFVESSALTYLSLHPSNACAVSICSESFSNINNTEFTTNDIPDNFVHN